MSGASRSVPHPFADFIGLTLEPTEPVLESEIRESDRLVAKALGTYSIHSRC